MIEDFDREIDALLRRTAQGERASANSRFRIPDSKSPHLDADEIVAYAENALPEKLKLNFTAHFADCRRCRAILSNVAALDSETPAEIVRAKKTKSAATAPIAWYRRLFAAPNPAYALGALLLIFVGLAVFIFTKNAAPNAEISQAREAPVNMSGGGGVSSDGETPEIETGASSNAMMMSNRAVSVQSNAAQTNAAMQNSARDGYSSSGSAMSNAGAVAAANKPVDAESEAAKNKSQNDAAVAPTLPPDENRGRGSSFAAPKSGKLEKEETRALENSSNLSDSVSSSATAAKPAAPKTDQPPAKSSETINRSADAMLKSPAKKSARTVETENAETRIVGGKTFRRGGNIWYDTTYGGQSATGVSRGSSEFKKLDAGLRSIADAFGGTIVVVFNGKAYRIQ